MTIRTLQKRKGALWCALGALFWLGFPGGSPGLAAQSASTPAARQAHALALFDAAILGASSAAVTLPRWDDITRFCIARRSDDHALTDGFARSLATVSDAYAFSFVVDQVSKLSDCDMFGTDVFIIVGPNQGNAAFKRAFETIIGAPIADLTVDFSRNLGFSFRFPGPDGAHVIFVASSGEGITLADVDAPAIFREELLQTLLNAADVSGQTPLTSQLYEVEPAAGYADWFDVNPTGWCTADLVLMELLFGTGPATDDPTTLRHMLVDGYDPLEAMAQQRRAQLSGLVDPRC